jgi:hypothetical protein
MPKSAPQPDVLVLGNHPSAYLAVALLRQTDSIRVAHCVIPGESLVDRLVTINPEFFDLHEMLGPLKRKLKLSPIYGLKFLADDPATSIMHLGKTIGAYIGCFKQVHDALLKLAAGSGATLHRAKSLHIAHLDETGVDVALDRAMLRAKVLIVAGELPAEQKRMIGLGESWDGEVPHRYTFLKMKGSRWFDAGSRPFIPMSLDLKGSLNWAWLLPGPGAVQLAVVQPLATGNGLQAAQFLQHWINVLTAHRVLAPSAGSIDLAAARSIDLPLAGALWQEGVANRTLLIGPAGGFYTACCEDVYPNCWSAVHAVDVVRKALRERHLQDALQPYRQKWGATLGDYLRGPQQNLRFLLPLVYRNAIMTARLSDAILSGKSVVR